MNIANISLKQMISAAMVAFVALFAASFFAMPAHAQVDTTDACAGVELTGGSCGTGGESSVGDVIETVVDILSVVVGAASVIMIIIGGLRYIISGGDSSQTASAKNTILYALVGLVIVILAQSIVAFVINRVDPAPAEPEGGYIMQVGDIA